MRQSSIEITRIKRKYDKILAEADGVAIAAYVWYKRIFRLDKTDIKRAKTIKEAKDSFKSSLTDQDFLNYLREKMALVKDILQAFKNEVVNYMVQNNIKLHHICANSTNDLKGQINPSLATTIYQESAGEYVFASSTEVAKYAYACRTACGGMFKIGEFAIMYPSKKFIDFKEGKLEAKRPIYCYSLEASNFEPVVTINSIHHPVICFDDEWISTEPQKVSEENCEIIKDLTPLLTMRRVFAFTNEKASNYATIRLLMDGTKRDNKSILKQMLEKGDICYFNQEVKKSKNERIV